MSDDQCPCCNGDKEPPATTDPSTAEPSTSTGSAADEKPAATAPATDRLLTDESVLDATLPRDVRSTLGRFLGVESVETLGEWAAAVRGELGGSIAIADLCHTDGETPHYGTVGGERYYFACFYDAVILAALRDRPVDIRTESPDGTAVRARAVGTDELTVSPPDAVFSFGIDESVTPPSADGPTLERAYAAVCPYVKAFPDRDTYERWAADAPAATVALPLAGATAVAEALVA